MKLEQLAKNRLHCIFIKSSLESCVEYISTIQRNLEAPIFTEDSEIQNLINLYGIYHLLRSIDDALKTLPQAPFVKAFLDETWEAKE